MRSAAKTPNCAVNDEATKMRVLVSAKGTFRCSVPASQRAGELALRLKYMAKSAAKNMTSLPSQTIVPTEVALGRLIVGEEKVAVDMCLMLTHDACQFGLIRANSRGFSAINLTS